MRGPCTLRRNTHAEAHAHTQTHAVNADADGPP